MSLTIAVRQSRDGVIPESPAGAASADAARGQAEAAQNAVFLYRLLCVFGTSRYKPARRPPAEYGRYGGLIDFD